MLEDICLVIKAANQKYDDVKVDCQLSWSILDLKNYLSINYPSKPVIIDCFLIQYRPFINLNFVFFIENNRSKNNLFRSFIKG